MSLKKNKDLKLYFSISEVAQMFDVNESTLRFWEKEFDIINPLKIFFPPLRVRTTSGRICMTALPKPPMRRASMSWRSGSVWSPPSKSTTRSDTAPYCAM